MPTRKACGFCKICKRQNVLFEYWETDGNSGYYRTNYEEKLAKAFICPNCHNNLKELLRKNENCEICKKCWDKVNYSNFDHTHFTKTIGKDCPACNVERETDTRRQQENQTRANQEQETDRKIAEQCANLINTCTSCHRDISKEQSFYLESDLTKHYCANCKPSGNISASIPDNFPSPSSTPSSYSPPNTNSTSTSTNCSECKKSISVGENVYTWPHLPNEKFCEPCGKQQEICFGYLQRIMQGADLRSQIEHDSQLTFENKISLLATNTIKMGRTVNIDKLNINEEEKEGLRKFQQQCANLGSLEYTIKCRDCGKEEKSALIWLKGTPCKYCNSLKVETWKDGKLHLGKNQEVKDPTKSPPVLVIVAFSIISSLIFWKLVLPRLKIWWKAKKTVKEDQAKYS